MVHVVRSKQYFDDLRHYLRQEVKAKLGHIDEAIARSIGFSTKAAMLAALERDGAIRTKWDGAAFSDRLTELAGTEPDHYALERAMLNMFTDAAVAEEAEEVGASTLELREDASAAEPKDEDDGDDGWIPPWELDEDDPLRWAWEHDENSRGNR